MAIHRTRKQKESPNYNFLYSWTPKGKDQAHVKGESKTATDSISLKHPASKKAVEWAKDDDSVRIKKDIIRSLIVVSFILALEIVIYLAWKRISVL